MCHGAMDEFVMIGQQSMQWCDNSVCHGAMDECVMIGKQSMQWCDKNKTLIYNLLHMSK